MIAALLVAFLALAVLLSANRQHTVVRSYLNILRLDSWQLQVKPQLDWDAYREKQNDLLNHYGWIDKTEGIVRVPISMAIDRMLSQGVPHWGPTNRSISPLELQHSRTNGGKR